MRCRMFRLFSRGAVSSLACVGLCVVLAAKVHRTERLLHRAAQEARQAHIQKKAMHKRWHILQTSWLP